MDKNKILLVWSIPEYRQHTRSRRWYIIAGLVFLLLLVTSLLAANFLFALILVIAGIILILQDKGSAPLIEFALATDGIALGRQTYAYDKFQSFWIYYEPDEAKTLFFEFKNKARPRLAVPLLSKNPLHVREQLLKFLPEDTTRQHEPLSEQLSRLLKL